MDGHACGSRASFWLLNDGGLMLVNLTGGEITDWSSLCDATMWKYNIIRGSGEEHLLSEWLFIVNLLFMVMVVLITFHFVLKSETKIFVTFPK